MRRVAIALVLVAVTAAPASAVVGGQRIKDSEAPWFASFDGCGGALVAPDRIVTAAHCVNFRSPADLERIAIGGTARHGIRFAMPPDWRRTNGANRLDDVALIRLDRPVTGVAPVKLGGSLPARVRVLGRGLSKAPSRGAGGIGDGKLREVVLRSLSDRACARNYRGKRGNGKERFDAARMLCAVDVDGRRPLSSACVGDSGGPVYVGSRRAPRLLGIVSWGGDRCGADRLASVFADVRRYAAFVASPAPVWAPAADGPATISGDARVGGTLSCAASWSVPPETIEVVWQRLAGGTVTTVGEVPNYTVVAADAGHVLACGIRAGNAGGIASAPTAAASAVHVPG